jgi:hypothetical protein
MGMGRKLRPSPSMVVSMVALLVSLSGAAYAGGLVGTNDIENGAVTTPKLHNGAVTKAKLHGNSVNGSKVVNDTLTGDDVNESTLGSVPNALKLQGFEADDFARAGTVLSGHGNITAGTPQSLFSSSLVHVGVATDGNADADLQLLITNNNVSGNLLGIPFTKAGPGTAFTIAAGGSTLIGPGTTANEDFLDTLITDAGNPEKSLWMHCFFKTSAGVPTAFCWGLQLG